MPPLPPLGAGNPPKVCAPPAPPASTTHPEVRAVRPNPQEPVRGQRLEAVEIVSFDRVEGSFGGLGAVLTGDRASRPPWPNRWGKRGQTRPILNSQSDTRLCA